MSVARKLLTKRRSLLQPKRKANISASREASVSTDMSGLELNRLNAASVLNLLMLSEEA